MQTSQILVVDDNPEIREILQILLSAEGFSFQQASDGISALQWVQTQDFDLIILDVMMPGPDGYQTCRAFEHPAMPPSCF